MSSCPSDISTWNNFLVYKRDDSIFQRVILPWTEDDQLDGDRVEDVLHHEYHACANIKTGDIYLDCRRRKIALKHFTLALFRPIHFTIKTIWHATIVGPLIKESILTFRGKNKEPLSCRMIKSCADIFRTPAYGVAMTVTHVVGLLLGCISPNTLYKTREIAGKLEYAFLRGKTQDAWAPCFMPIRKITSYNLSDFGKKNIRFRRNKRAIFNDCCLLLSVEKAYISAADSFPKDKREPYSLAYPQYKFLSPKRAN